MIIGEELNEIFNRIKEEELIKVIQQVRKTNTNIDYLGVAKQDNSKISYLNESKLNKIKECENYDLLWDGGFRIMAKPGKVLKMIIPDISDVLLELFTNFYKMQTKICDVCLDDEVIKIVKGESIKTYYHEDNYTPVEEKDEGCSPIHCSCMRYGSCSDYLDIYSKNPQVSMAIYPQGGYISARCILWHKEDKTYYDRIYATSDKINSFVQACLEKKGFINISNSNIIKPTEDIELQIKLDYGQHDLEQFPYCDTMNKLSGKYISNYIGDVTLNETEGTHSGIESDDNYTYCTCCDERIHNDNVYEVIRGASRWSYICEDCGVYSSYYGGYLLESEATDTHYDGWILREDSCILHDGRDCHEDCANLLWNGKYAHQDEDTLEDVDGERFLDGDENFIEVEGDWYYITSDLIVKIEGDWYLVDSEEIELIDGEYKIKEYV